MKGAQLAALQVFRSSHQAEARRRRSVRSGSRKGAEMGRKDAPFFGPQLFLTPSGPVMSSLNRPRQTARGAARGPAAGAGGPADR